MFERLSALFAARKERLSSQAEATKDNLVEAVAKSQGIALSPKPTPPAYGKLTPTQFRAFESAYKALLERMAIGASGLAPDFAELERTTIRHISAGGWAPSASAISDLSLSARAAVCMLEWRGRREIPNAFWANDMGAIHQAYKQALDRLSAVDSAVEKAVVRQHLFTHPECADAFVHLYWRDERNRTHTYFDIVLGFGPPFAEAMTEAMLADVVFQTFRRSFACDIGPLRLVTGGFWLGGRDGVGTKLTGFVLNDRTFESLASEGVILSPSLLSLSLYERLL